MNKKEFLVRLAEIMSCFIVHRLLTGELIDALKHSGNEQTFLGTLFSRLKFLDEQRIYATRHKEFEPLADGIYSMHLTGNGFNIRILYGFLPDQRPALLLSFYERGGHRSTDYTGQISIALKRLKELQEEI